MAFSSQRIRPLMQEGSERGTGNAVMESWAEKNPVQDLDGVLCF
jgi:hypothetical protein